MDIEGLTGVVFIGLILLLALFWIISLTMSFIKDRFCFKIHCLEIGKYTLTDKINHKCVDKEFLVKLTECNKDIDKLRYKKKKINHYAILFEKVSSSMLVALILCFLVVVICDSILDYPDDELNNLALKVARAVQCDKDYIDDLKGDNIEYTVSKLDENLDKVEITIKNPIGNYFYTTGDTTLYIETNKNKVYTNLDDVITDY